jgi:RNA polymerase sigma-70 factor, ECF subfamily
VQPEPDDSAISAAVAGDDDALAAVFRYWHPRVVAYLRARGAENPEDVASEVWLSVVRGLPRFRGGGAGFGGWLFTIARRRLVDQRRLPAVPAEPGADLEQLAAQDDTPEAVGASMSHEAALRRIAALPTDQAEVVLLRVVAGLDVATVARMLGKSPGAVRVQQHRALRRLAAQGAEVTN